ncbi:MAG: hypothetical protein ABJL55_08625 [Roseibium sp.]
MTDLDAIHLFGTKRAPEPFQLLRAGPLEVRLENGNLRYVRYDGFEVLRAISYVVRDKDWGTLAPQIENLTIDQATDGFEVSYSARFLNDGVTLTVDTRISGSQSGQLTFDTKAIADGDFETNRCGFNILHPINGVAGAPVTVEHCDGTLVETVFPKLIEPWQPFKSIRALTHSPAPHLTACCKMEGDTFEMEDQRNWSDASYKTYVRPIELPWPYIIKSNQQFDQSVSLDIEVVENVRMSDIRPNSDTDTSVELSIGEPLGKKLPSIGLQMDPEHVELTLEKINLLKQVKPQSILCHFDPTAGHDLHSLKAFRSLQRAFPVQYDLEYVVACDGDLDVEFKRLAGMVSECGLELASLAVCPSVDRQSTPPGSEWPNCPPLEDIYRAARAAFPKTTLGGGMFSYFTELNRKRPPIALLDYVTHATNPIVHAADDDSVMETLETLPHITQSARAIIGEGKPYRLGPTTIGMRQNPYGSQTFENPNDDRICMAHDDPRQRGRFAAAWVLGYASRITDAGIEHWIPSAFVGPRGLLSADNHSLLPIAKAVEDLCRMNGLPLLSCSISDPKRIAAVGFQTNDGPRLLVANLTSEQQSIRYGKKRILDPLEIAGI